MVSNDDLELVVIGGSVSESYIGTYWYRVASLKPFLRDTTRVSRHVYRNQRWYVLRNSLTGRCYRFNAAVYFLIGRMDGRQTVRQLWEKAAAVLETAAPTRDEVIRLLVRLHEADLIQSDILPSTEALLRHYKAEEYGNLKQRFTNPFSLRFPIFNPERFLRKANVLTAFLFSRGAGLLWLVILLAGAAAGVMHWPELSNSLNAKLLSNANLVLLWLVYPFVKTVHEFGHALAVKRWGGEVREMGIMLLAFTPVPYVDASASASFPDKRHRMAVAAMGMVFELFLAVLALFVWLNVEPGIVSTLAYDVMLISGISTVLFNANPLLRYDGYYILSDLLEIPNLNQRSGLYLGYLIQRCLLGLKTAESPVTSPGEEKWFILYGPVSFCYRMTVLAGLVLLVGSKFFLIGGLIAVWGVVGLIVLPFARVVSRFLSNPEVRSRPWRTYMLGSALALGAMLLLFIFPVSLWTTTQGVVWLPEQSIVRAGTDFEVVEILAPDGQFVTRGTPLIRGEDTFLNAEIELSRARLEELYAVYNAQPIHERVRRSILMEEIDVANEDKKRIEEKAEKLLVRSPAPGRLVLIEGRNLHGRFVKKGDTLGYIVSEEPPTIRSIVHQADIDLVRNQAGRVSVLLSEQVSAPIFGEIERIVPAADLNLPSAALGMAGGGMVPVDPTDPNGLRAIETFFQVDIRLPKQVRTANIGERVYVRFEHGRMPIALQCYRALRQLLIRKFYV